jgi:hypothetical protein
MTRKIFTRRDPARPRLASYLSAGRPARKNAGIWLTSVSTIALALVALASPSAMAATGYSLYPGSTWNVRSCPATCGVLGTMSGSIPNLVCQTGGPAASVSGFGTSTVYDLVRMPSGALGYMSDLGVQQTPYAQFSPNLPRCTAAPGPATQQASSSGYGWILSCSAAVLNGEDWACWTAGLRTLFLPGSAS